VNITRRDVLLALSVLGVGTYRAASTPRRDTDDGSVATLLAVAEVLCPSSVDIDAEFVESSVIGRSHVLSNHEAEVTTALAELNRRARADYGRAFAALGPTKRRAVLRSLGALNSHSEPDGLRSQQLRYYLVNNILYALYATPVGGQAVGVENPPGYPGGREAYQRGPNG
jgi:hypothetical protein